MLSDQQVDRFLKKASFAGLLTIYAFKLSIEKKISFNKKTLFQYMGSIFPDYTYGFMIASMSFDALDFNDKDDIITVISLDPRLSAKIKDKLSEYTNDIYKKWILDLEKRFQV